LNELVRVARDLQDLFLECGWEFCFIGGLAVQCWSEPRFTKDVDVTLVTGIGGEDLFVDALLQRYQPRRPDARPFALVNRVLLLKSDDGIGIDVALGALGFERDAVSRAREVEVFPGVRLRVCSPEDLIVMKAFASRDQDWHDVRFTVARQGHGALDWDYIYGQLEPLAEVKEEPEIVARLRGIQAAARQRGGT
jgi:hypothetical protein